MNATERIMKCLFMLETHVPKASTVAGKSYIKLYPVLQPYKQYRDVLYNIL